MVKRLLALALLLASPLANALPDENQGITEFDNYRVHYSVIPSTFLEKKVAREYDLTRSRSVGLLNVAVHKTSGDDAPKPITAQIKGTFTNEARQTKELSFRRVQEGDAVYYLAQFQYRQGELLIFELEPAPYGDSTTLPVRFSRELYDDE
ncbi:DUF4426 domain-containing protein [Halospina sp. K52047b]|uniref:DUF4426 domain-containing protein n=1 Tax=Halospina sp. K52047b TaxID=2614160 RepID=UPI00124A7EE4|nr:DUF4426 domain-containing protein [Halospina sp. K52047b]KAA8981220.1 DUF4426 domain-containing protein [Halospina sp. K52047b]